MDEPRLTERQEAEVALASRAPNDVISDAVGSSAYSANHRFPGLREALFQETRRGTFAISRFYFAVEPKVAVDVVAKPGMVAREIATKRAYCERNGIRYVLISDAHDDVGVREQLTAVAVPAVADPVPRTTASPKPRTTATQKPRRAKTAA